ELEQGGLLGPHDFGGRAGVGRSRPAEADRAEGEDRHQEENRRPFHCSAVSWCVGGYATYPAAWRSKQGAYQRDDRCRRPPHAAILLHRTAPWAENRWTFVCLHLRTPKGRRRSLGSYSKTRRRPAPGVNVWSRLRRTTGRASYDNRPGFQ